MAADPVLQGQLFIEFITAHLRQIIAAGIEEHRIDQALRTLNRQRLAGTDFL